MKKYFLILAICLLFSPFAKSQCEPIRAYRIASLTTPLNRNVVAGDEIRVTANGRSYIITKPYTANASVAYIILDGGYVLDIYSGTSAFSTNGTRVAVYIKGAASTDVYAVTPLAATASTRPVAGDVLSYYAKTDSLIVQRQAGTTSGLTFGYLRVK